MILLTKHLRFYLEYNANKSQKENPLPKDVELKSVKAGDVPAEWQTSSGIDLDRVIMYIHGGGHIMGSVNTKREFTVRLGRVTNMRILSLDYRLAPEHSHPAALNDCVSAYEWLLSIGIDHKNIIISGDSAGGYYTLMTLLKLRDERKLLPAGAICLSPSTDMAKTGESVIRNSLTDYILGDTGCFWWGEVYLDGADPFDPTVSPLYADLKDLPPILIQVSTSEMLFDDSRKFYERAKEAGVKITMQTWDNTLHVFQDYPELPETKEAMQKIEEFVKELFQD